MFQVQCQTIVVQTSGRVARKWVNGLHRYGGACLFGFAFLVSPQAGAAAGSESSTGAATRALPAGARGEAIETGRKLMSDTAHLLPRYVGNGLNCTNCHLNGGTTANASPWTGIWGVFPEYRARSGKLISLQERINDCMERSMNGHALSYDSLEMDAMLAYIQWLSEGVPTGSSPPGRGFGKIDTTLVADEAHGREVYAARCASCHAADGAGVHGPNGTYTFPPLWGHDSFNVGAGMARTYTAAAFIRHNMPLGQPDSLTEQDAVDVAQFVTHQPRPDFPGRKKDWPKGEAPADARLE